MKYLQLKVQPIFILLLVTLILTPGVSSKPASTDYEDYEARSFEVMSFDDKASGPQDTNLGDSSRSSFDYLEYSEHPIAPQQETLPDLHTAEITSSSVSNSSTNSSAVRTAFEDEGLSEYYEEYDDHSNTPTSESPTEDGNFEQEIPPFAKTRFVPLYSPQTSKNSQEQNPRRPKVNSNGNPRQPRPTVPKIQPDPLQQTIPVFPTSESQPPPIYQPVVVSKVNPAALPSFHAATPHRLVVELSQMEQSIKRRFKELQDKIDQMDQRITNVFNTSISGLRKEYLASKEQMKAIQEQQATRIRELSKRTNQKFQSARRERETLYGNSEILRRSMNSHKAHHEEELKQLAIGAAQNFGIVQEEVTRLFNMINRLSHIQNGAFNPSLIPFE